MKDSIKKSLLAISKALTGDEYKLGTDEYNQIYEVLTTLLAEQRQAVIEIIEKERYSGATIDRLINLIETNV